MTAYNLTNGPDGWILAREGDLRGTNLGRSKLDAIHAAASLVESAGGMLRVHKPVGATLANAATETSVGGELP